MRIEVTARNRHWMSTSCTLWVSLSCPSYCHHQPKTDYIYLTIRLWHSKKLHIFSDLSYQYSWPSPPSQGICYISAHSIVWARILMDFNIYRRTRAHKKKKKKTPFNLLICCELTLGFAYTLSKPDNLCHCSSRAKYAAAADESNSKDEGFLTGEEERMVV
jgi:hypothetical protein